MKTFSIADLVSQGSGFFQVHQSIPPPGSPASPAQWPAARDRRNSFVRRTHYHHAPSNSLRPHPKHRQSRDRANGRTSTRIRDHPAYRRLGKKTVARNPETKTCWTYARLVFRLAEADLRRQAIDLLAFAATQPACPERTRTSVKWFLTAMPSATVAYANPHADLPLTTGAAEAMCKRLRRTLLQVRPTSAAQAQRAVDVCFRVHARVRCAGALPALGLTVVSA